MKKSGLFIPLILVSTCACTDTNNKLVNHKLFLVNNLKSIATVQFYEDSSLSDSSILWKLLPEDSVLIYEEVEVDHQFNINGLPYRGGGKVGTAFGEFYAVSATVDFFDNKRLSFTRDIRSEGNIFFWDSYDWKSQDLYSTPEEQVFFM
ncbi:MAG: hypothetical protein OXH57_00390 [Ekhidna sp.]|nr:hypothetical protein [Ekhidna sp.]